ncbi:MAG TPA: ATP-grasp domain-containing protein [Methanothrix sp.]|nr:ATP-grasp domain-containing protein [Methanothrix sp.]
MRLLAIGINIRHIAASASRAGHEVMAVDCYCDCDLSKWAKKTAKMPRTGWEKCIPVFMDEFQPDAVVFGPGLEEVSLAGANVLNNSPEKTSVVSDKLWLARWLEKNGFPFIRTESSPEHLDYPFLVKPRRGAGGLGCRAVRSPSELCWQDDLIAQELLSGRPASVSVIGNGREGQAIAVNEQLIGLDWAGAKGFRYSGNITPLSQAPGEMSQMAEEIIAKLGLVGSNGVDFLLTDEGPVPVEVNSRFQGSLDTVEIAHSINVFQAHLQSFSGLLPEPMSAPRCTAGRAILYAPHDLAIDADLQQSWTSDVPQRGSRIAADEPLLSITARGSNRDEALILLKRRAAMLYETLKTK